MIMVWGGKGGGLDWVPLGKAFGGLARSSIC